MAHHSQYVKEVNEMEKKKKRKRIYFEVLAMGFYYKAESSDFRLDKLLCPQRETKHNSTF